MTTTQQAPRFFALVRGGRTLAFTIYPHLATLSGPGANGQPETRRCSLETARDLFREMTRCGWRRDEAVEVRLASEYEEGARAAAAMAQIEAEGDLAQTRREESAKLSARARMERAARLAGE